MTQLRDILKKAKTGLRLLTNLPGIRENQHFPALPSLQRVPEQKEASSMMRNFGGGYVNDDTSILDYFVSIKYAKKILMEKSVTLWG